MFDASFNSYILQGLDGRILIITYLERPFVVLDF